MKGRPVLVWGLALLAACDAVPGRRTPGAAERAGSDSVLSRADSLYRAGSFSAARDLWEDGLAQALERGDSAEAARVLTSLGLAARQLGDYEESYRLGHHALALKRSLGMRDDLFRSYNALGLLAWTRGDLEEAASMYERAGAAAASAGDALGEAKAAGNMAHVHLARGEPYLAREGFTHLAEASRKADDSVALARTLINLGNVEIGLGQPVEAVARLDEARRITRETGDAEAEENALGQLAMARAAMGEPQRALATLDTALALAERHAMRRQQAEDWKLLGDLYAEAGDVRRALDQYARAQAVNAELQLLEESANASFTEARSLQALGHADTALARARLALELHRSGGYLLAQVEDHLLLAELQAQRGQEGDARTHLRAAAALSVDLGSPATRARVALGSARVFEALGRPEMVLQSLDRSSGELAHLGASEVWEPDALRARAHASLGSHDSAVARGRDAVASVERVRRAYAPGPLRTSFLSARSDVYADLVVALLAQGRVGEALEVADAARGRALLDHLAAARVALADPGRPAADVLALDRLLREIDALSRQLESMETVPPRERGEADVASARFVAARLDRTRREFEDRLARLPARSELTLLGARPVGLAAMREALRPGEAILEYLATESALVVFVVSSEEIEHLELSVRREDLASRVRLARDLASRRDGGPEAQPVLRALHGILLEPVLRSGLLAGVDRLVIVPHGPLSYVPFAALTDDDGQPVVRRFAIAVLPSASALAALRAPVAAGRLQPTGTSPAFALAPLPDALPATRREVDAVREVTAGRVLVGRAATEAVARSALTTGRSVHIASHGSMNAANPMFSRIDLAAGSTGDPADDGRLEIHEVLGLRVASELVFLSGCETGRGASWATGFERSDDYATLAQAFLYAGARNVVATLWRVDDAGAARLAERFYRALDGDPVAALAEAQRAMLDDPEFAAPYYWASYEVLGAGTNGT